MSHCEHHCRHSFDHAGGLAQALGGLWVYFCCGLSCKDVLVSEVQIEEKTHGGPIFGPGAMPRLTLRRSRPVAPPSAQVGP